LLPLVGHGAEGDEAVRRNDQLLKTPKKRSNPIDTHIGGRLRQRRLELENSPARMARILGLTTEEYEQCENGTRRLGAVLLVRATRLLETPISWFFEGIAQPVAGEVAPENPATADTLLRRQSVEPLPKAPR
jgi:transcriptional regulator with XRE-family HTH domain